VARRGCRLSVPLFWWPESAAWHRTRRPRSRRHPQPKQSRTTFPTHPARLLILFPRSPLPRASAIPSLQPRTTGTLAAPPCHRVVYLFPGRAFLTSTSPASPTLRACSITARQHVVATCTLSRPPLLRGHTSRASRIAPHYTPPLTLLPRALDGARTRPAHRSLTGVE
jgi:hypothetical protein